MKKDFLSRYRKARLARCWRALLDRYMNTGIYEIEKTDILKLLGSVFVKLGKPARIAGYFLAGATDTCRRSKRWKTQFMQMRQVKP